jgi:hypothetical protein
MGQRGGAPTGRQGQRWGRGVGIGGASDGAIMIGWGRGGPGAAIIGGLGVAASLEGSVGKGSSESDGLEKRRSKLVNGVGTARQSGRGLGRWLLPHVWRRKNSRFLPVGKDRCESGRRKALGVGFMVGGTRKGEQLPNQLEWRGWAAR